MIVACSTMKEKLQYCLHIKGNVNMKDQQRILQDSMLQGAPFRFTQMDKKYRFRDKNIG